MEVFGQAAAANLTVTSVKSHPFPPPSLHGVTVPHTDARWAISITVYDDELTKPLQCE